MARLFQLVRDEDVSGISGTGIVAEGIEFSDGRVALRWRGEHGSTVIHDSVANVVRIHGHQGRTRVAYAAGSPPAEEPPALLHWHLLSPRQRDVARGILAGRSNKEIAARLFTTERTVKNHVVAIFRQFGVPSRTALVIALWPVRDRLDPPAEVA